MQEKAKPFYRAAISLNWLYPDNGEKYPKVEHIVFHFHKEWNGKADEIVVADRAIAVKMAKEILEAAGELYMTRGLRNVLNTSPSYSVTANTIRYEDQLKALGWEKPE